MATKAILFSIFGNTLFEIPLPISELNMKKLHIKGHKNSSMKNLKSVNENL